MTPATPTPEQLDAILDLMGHEPCPGVEIEFNVPLGSVPGGPELYATVYRPSQRPTAPTPALLGFHGGGWIVGDPNGCGALAKMLAVTLGMPTLSASYRLATEGVPTYPGVLADGRHAWRWLVQHAAEWQIDPSRIAVAGESAGVLMAAHLAVNSPIIALSPSEPRPAALIAQCGPMDFIARWFDRGENPGAESAIFGCGYAENPRLYHEASPLAHAGGKLPPALLLYGRQDMVVHPRQGRLAHAAWKAAGAHSELIVLNNYGHSTEGDNRAERAQALRAAVDFLAARLF
jgi:acetyl esterase/lipase